MTYFHGREIAPETVTFPDLVYPEDEDSDEESKAESVPASVTESTHSVSKTKTSFLDDSDSSDDSDEDSPAIEQTSQSPPRISCSPVPWTTDNARPTSPC